jgi:hypothetical protein
VHAELWVQYSTQSPRTAEIDATRHTHRILGNNNNLKSCARERPIIIDFARLFGTPDCSTDHCLSWSAMAYNEERPRGYPEHDTSEAYRASAGSRNRSHSWPSQGGSKHALHVFLLRSTYQWYLAIVSGPLFPIEKLSSSEIEPSKRGQSQFKNIVI